MGSALGGILASFNFSLLFWVDGITNLSAAFLLYITLSPKRNKATEKKERGKKLAALNSAYNDRAYLYFIVLVFLFAICFFQLFTTVPVFFKEEFHLSVLFIGMIMALNGLIITLLEMLIVFGLEGKRPSLQFISGGVLLVCVAFFTLTLPTTNYALSAVIAMIFLTFGEILAMPFMNAYWIGRTMQYNRGQYAALYSVAWAAAQTIAPYAGSQLVEHSGYKMLWIVVGCICLLLTILYFKLQNNDRLPA